MGPASVFRGQKVEVASYPSPIGGWNARDPLAAMPPTDAVKLENWFCRVGDCIVRGGCANHLTGMASAPKSLMLHSPPTGTNRMFAASNTGIYAATSAGAVGASVATSTNGYWNWVQMGVSGGHYLLAFNGTDKPLYYNGTTWVSVDGVSVPALTGVTTTLLITANVFKRRLFVIEKNKASFWYLPVDAVGGALVEFPLGPLCSKGGYVMAMGTWTVDGGSGPDDYAVFITSEGELIVFSGTDPGSVASWALVGVYDLRTKPLGRKCFYKLGGDLLILTTNGVLPLSKATPANVNFKMALTDIIYDAFTTAARTAQALEGWEAAFYPAQNALVINIPVSGGTVFEQFVMNTITKGWCRFPTGWTGARAFAVFNNELYFADATKISKAWTGTSDYGANIVASAQSAFNYFGKKTASKEWVLTRPQLLTDGPLTFSQGLAIDFNTPAQLATATYSVTIGARWDVGLWDASYWAAGVEVKNAWQTPAAPMGYCASMLLQVATNSLEVRWASIDYVFKRGGILG